MLAVYFAFSCRSKIQNCSHSIFCFFRADLKYRTVHAPYSNLTKPVPTEGFQIQNHRIVKRAMTIHPLVIEYKGYLEHQD